MSCRAAFVGILCVLLLPTGALRADLLYVADVGNNSILALNASGTVTNQLTGYAGPQGTAMDSAGNLYVANNSSATIVQVPTSGGTAVTFATLPAGSGPQGLVFDNAGNLYVVNNGTSTISKVAPDGSVSTFASGLPTITYATFDSQGNLYVSAFSFISGGELEKITPSGQISTFATGLGVPEGVKLGPDGNFYVADVSTNTIWKVTQAAVVTQFASGSALINPKGLAFDSAGNLYVANAGNTGSNGSIAVVNSLGQASTFAQAGLLSPADLAFVVPATVAEPSSLLLTGLGAGVIYACRRGLRRNAATTA
jgi:sugar lactone lactonase YvrE